jgi:hypothetical protein
MESREAKIPHGFEPSVITIDGPLPPIGADLQIRRHIEAFHPCSVPQSLHSKGLRGPTDL